MHSKTFSFLLLLAALFHREIRATTPTRLPPVPQQVGEITHPLLDLQGTWKFHEQPSARFWENVNDTSGWKSIAVPGEWTMQGFHVPVDRYAGYQRTFTLPASWRDQSVILRCDGVYSDAQVYVNGHPAGRHQGGFTPFELDITSMLNHDGENRLCLQVKNESLADTLASAAAYAAHPLGGITRKIYLLARPALYCESLMATTTFDSAFSQASLHLQLQARNRSQSLKSASVRFELYDPGRQPVPASPYVFALGTIAPDSVHRQKFTLEVPEAMTWDSEHPRLYTLLCTLSYDGQRQQIIRQRIGLRQIEVRGQQLFVNGRPIKLRGVNRHEVHPQRGRSLTPSLWRQDAELYKAANINYIRTSHYPPAEEFIEACDSLGLFVEEEAPLVWIGHGANPRWQAHDPHDRANYPLLAQALTEMIERDRNHPSVLMWSLANESEWGPLWQRLLALADQLDSSRPKTFHDQAWGRYNNHGSIAMPIANYHYPGLGDLDSVAQMSRPVLFGEYCHLNCYNRREIVTDPGIRDEYGRALIPIWEKIMATPGCLGGAIWSGIDDIFQLPDGREVGYGSWGPLDGRRRPKPEYWHIKMAYAPVNVLDTLLTCTPPYRLRVLNRYNFTDLAELSIQWQVLDKEGRLTAQAAPLQTAELTIPYPDPVAAGTRLSVRFVNPSGQVVQSVCLPMGLKREQPLAVPRQRLHLDELPERWSISIGPATWAIDKGTGLISEAALAGRTIVRGGPHLMLLPLLSGPCSTEHQKHIPEYNDICSDWRRTSAHLEKKQEEIVIKITGSYHEAEGEFIYHFRSDGYLKIDYHFTALIDIKPRQTGIVMDLDSALTTLRWHRQAQWSVYPDDHIGRADGIARAAGEVMPGSSWSRDDHELGCNDFRSSKRNINLAALGSENGMGLQVLGYGKKTVRAFMSGGRAHMLIADYSTGGADLFIDTHYAGERLRIKKGDRVEGSCLLRIQDIR